MKKCLFSLVLMVCTGAAFAQANDPVVMKINGKEIKKSEFDYIYNKNNGEDAIDKRSLEDYIALFTNFKLKVAEAEAQGVDTTAAFRKELNEYRSQLAKSYLNTEENEQLLSQAFSRANTWADLSAILITFPKKGQNGPANITPADTLEAYRKIMEVRNKALQKGVSFEDLVKEYTADERSKQSDRPGYMGWYSGLNLIPTLEMPVYTTPVGKISQPVRTAAGYYLLKVLDKKNDPGEVHAAHILIKPDADSTKTAEKIAEIYQKLKNGTAFADLAKEYSEDPGSATKGGDLSWFPFGQMVPEFNAEVFSMKDSGAISQPVKSQFGYHIIQLLGKRPGETFDKLRPQLVTKIERTGGFTDLHQTGIDQLKKKYNYQFNNNAYQTLAAAASELYPADSLYITQFADNQETLFTVEGKAVTLNDFAAYLKKNPYAYSNLSTEALKEKFDQLVYDKLMEAEDKGLENKYPEFRNLVQEYRDGILLFDVSNREVWEKASADTLGLTSYFEAHKSKYAWDEPHWKGYVVMIKDAKLKPAMQKAIAKMTPDAAANYLLEKYKSGNDSLASIRIEKGLFVKGQNPYVDETVFKTGKAELPKGYGALLLIGKYLPNMPENYNDVRGLVITDYQDYLEQEWIKGLNAKYPVSIYKDVIEKDIK